MSEIMINIAFYMSLVESILGVLIFGVYTLLGNCAIQVNCPNNRIEELAYVFYTTYVKEKDSCDVKNNGTEIGEITSNENDLTQPQNIFYIELVLLLLNISLMGAALLLPKMKTQRKAGVPWMFLMLLTIVMDLAASGIAVTDYHHPESTGFSCSLKDDWIKTRRTLTVTALLLVFSRGVFVWLLNCLIFIFIAYKYYVNDGTKHNKVAPVINNSKTSQENLWMSYPGPQDDDLEDERHDFPGHPPPQVAPTHHHNPHSQGVYHVPHQHSSSNYNSGRDINRTHVNADEDKGIRRAPSFADRLREAEANKNPFNKGSHQLWSYTDPNAKMELRSRGENLRHSKPDEDVDTAFDFLENYTVKDDALDKSSLDVRTKKNSFYLSQILEPQNDEIPRARVPDVSNGSSRPQSPLGYDQNRGPGSRYFVPLKQ